MEKDVAERQRVNAWNQDSPQEVAVGLQEMEEHQISNPQWG